MDNFENSPVETSSEKIGEKHLEREIGIFHSFEGKARSLAALFLLATSLSINSSPTMASGIEMNGLNQPVKISAESNKMEARKVNISPEAKQELASYDLSLKSIDGDIVLLIKSTWHYTLEFKNSDSIDFSVREPNDEDVLKYLKDQENTENMNRLFHSFLLAAPNQSNSRLITLMKANVITQEIAHAITSNKETRKEVVDKIGKIIVVIIHNHDGSVSNKYLVHGSDYNFLNK